MINLLELTGARTFIEDKPRYWPDRRMGEIIRKKLQYGCNLLIAGDFADWAARCLTDHVRDIGRPPESITCVPVLDSRVAFPPFSFDVVLLTGLEFTPDPRAIVAKAKTLAPAIIAVLPIDSDIIDPGARWAFELADPYALLGVVTVHQLMGIKLLLCFARSL